MDGGIPPGGIPPGVALMAGFRLAALRQQQQMQTAQMIFSKVEHVHVAILGQALVGRGEGRHAVGGHQHSSCEGGRSAGNHNLPRGFCAFPLAAGRARAVKDKCKLLKPQGPSRIRHRLSPRRGLCRSSISCAIKYRQPAASATQCTRKAPSVPVIQMSPRQYVTPAMRPERLVRAPRLRTTQKI